MKETKTSSLAWKECTNHYAKGKIINLSYQDKQKGCIKKLNCYKEISVQLKEITSTKVLKEG